MTPSTSRNRSARSGRVRQSRQGSRSGLQQRRPESSRKPHYLHAESEENDMSTTSEHFPTEVADLPEACAPELIELSDGDQFDLRIAPVAKQLGDNTVRMLAYDGSIPGPTLKVQEGSEILVNVENQGDLETT